MAAAPERALIRSVIGRGIVTPEQPSERRDAVFQLVTGIVVRVWIHLRTFRPRSTSATQLIGVYVVDRGERKTVRAAAGASDAIAQSWRSPTGKDRLSVAWTRAPARRLRCGQSGRLVSAGTTNR